MSGSFSGDCGTLGSFVLSFFFGACCLDVRTLAFRQPLTVKLLAGEQKATELSLGAFRGGRA